jgi:vacuolar-type H+-ATPase subunit F/Vma7
MTRVAVIGGEDLTLGFSMIGVDSFKKNDIEKLLVPDTEYGILLIEEKIFERLNLVLKRRMEFSRKPIVIILTEDKKGGINLREKIVKSLGIDLMK